MFNLQGSEIIFILLLALVVLGPEKLPSAIRRFTQTYGELRKMGTGFQSELKSALDEPMREMKETAGMIRDQADPAKIAADAEAAAEAAAASDAAMKAERDAEREMEAQRTARPEPVVSSDDETVAASSADTPSGVDHVDEWADPVEPDDEGPVQESA